MTTCETCLKIRQKLKKMIGGNDGKIDNTASSADSRARSKARQVGGRHSKEKNGISKSQN